MKSEDWLEEMGVREAKLIISGGDNDAIDAWERSGDAGERPEIILY